LLLGRGKEKIPSPRFRGEGQGEGLNVKTRQRARELRQNMTDAERLLWYCLRDRRLGVFKFRRQHSVGPFLVDFGCPEKKN